MICCGWFVGSSGWLWIAVDGLLVKKSCCGWLLDFSGL